MSRYTDWRAQISESEIYASRPVSERTFYRRDSILKNEGFLPFERLHLNTANLGSPGMRAMRRGRRSWYAKAAFEGMNRDEWDERVLRKYRRNNWVFPPHSNVAGKYDPWQQLEHVKEKKRLKDTPSEKRKVGTHDGDELKRRLGRMR